MIDDFATKGRMRKADEERKKLLIQLSKDIGFESRMFPLEFKHNTKEPLRYFLWQCELMKWLVQNNYMSDDPIDLYQLEEDLTEAIQIHTSK